MAIVVGTNISSIIAQSYVNNTSNNIQKNIERLSSGLRINSAADDASGLAISEKLKAQISGLTQASSNAQDGISMLQTAEGGLSTIQDMTQRMRELAVQAANGTYTSSDREEIQKEVDQLKEEINRVANSTEFNTKNLLNGDATALWSSNSSDIDVVVNGNVNEGNYNLNVSVTDTGKNYVYKTDVMTLSDDALGASIVTSNGNDTNLTSVSDLKTVATSGTSYYTVKIADTAVGGASASVTAAYLQSGSSFSVNNVSVGTTTTNSGYLEVKFTSDSDTANTTVNVSYRFINASSGSTATDWTAGTATLNASGVATITANAGGGAISFNVNIGTSGSITEGDKILFSVSEEQTVTGVAASGGGTVTISGGPDAQAGPTIVFTGRSTLTKNDNGDSTVDTNAVTVYYATLDESTGNLNLGNMTLNFKELDSTDTTVGGFSAGQTLTGSISLKVNGAGDIATTSTKLKDIALFTTDDGANLFDQTQELTIYGNGTSATIYLEGDDTVSDFENKLQSAIVDELGMGADTSTSDEVSNVNNNLVNYVSQSTSNTNEALGGTFVIQSAKLGSDSQLAFVGDENLINALSLATIQEGENSELTVKVTNAHTGETVGSDTVNDYTLKNVIEGVNVSINSSVGLDISWDDTNKKMTFAKDSAEDIKLHLVDNSTTLQIGANEGQTLDVSIAQADTDALGLTNVTMVDEDSASSSISVIDKALSKISDARATIGAQINRLDYTISGLDTQNENLTASNSRIRDLDMAAEMSDYTTNQILSQAGVSMISQANSQAQLALSLLG